MHKQMFKKFTKFIKKLFIKVSLYYRQFVIKKFYFKNDFHWEVHRLFAVCFCCKSMKMESLFMCRRCKSHYFEDVNINIFEESFGDLKNTKNKISVNVYSIFKWYPDIDPVLNVLIPRIKGGKFLKYLEEIVDIFLNHKNKKKFNDSNKIFIPAPSKSKLPDHAFYLAKDFAQKSNGYFCDALLVNNSDFKKSKHIKQKNKRKSERLLLSLCLKNDIYKIKKTNELVVPRSFKNKLLPNEASVNEKIDPQTSLNLFMEESDICEKITKEDLLNSSIVFVDDVFTTGATARAAYKALGGPKNFEVWVLAKRQRALI